MLSLPSFQPRLGGVPAKVRTYTFGCKVNFADTVAIEEAFARRGISVLRGSESSPDIVVINTCAVTAQAERQARQLLRRVHREHPRSRIVVTGCAAQANPQQLQKIAGVSHLIPISEQRRIPEILGFGVEDPGNESPVDLPSSRTRAVLKLQDGCNAYCSFCILPYLRGRSRSVSVRELTLKAASLDQLGFFEIVLTGTHLGAYGRDLQPRMRFSDVVRVISDAAPSVAIRISSIEPSTIRADFVAMVRALSIVRPHFHVPLQSGSDRILRRMNRKYSIGAYSERIRMLSESRADLAIGTDIIAGFPGETEEDFQKTCAVIEALPFTYLHVFPFSVRPGTRSSKMIDDVPAATKHRRCEALRRIGSLKTAQFCQSFLGQILPVLIEGKRDGNGRLRGYTPHYLPVRILGPDRLMRRNVNVRLLRFENNTIFGEAA